jgi:NAD(P)-dependent dehydrogenase (short-subunit alcohol dehydrogenase family)
MAREGADLTIVYLPQEQPDADEVKAAVEKEGRKCHLIATDLAIKANCEKVVKEHLEVHGRLDILINNHSKQMQCKDTAEIDLDNVQSTFETNIISCAPLHVRKWCPDAPACHQCDRPDQVLPSPPPPRLDHCVLELGHSLQGLGGHV